MRTLADLCRPASDRLVEQYRAAPVKHADGTGWRCDGANGYAWGFFTPDTSIFRCRGTRSGDVALEVLGAGRAGEETLVVDRYGGYNRFGGNIQYCYAHLKRDTEDIVAANPDSAENNRAERDLRPLVIARKTRFGSQSEKGRETREILMSVLNTLAKRGDDAPDAFTAMLDALVENPKLDVASHLFGEALCPVPG